LLSDIIKPKLFGSIFRYVEIKIFEG